MSLWNERRPLCKDFAFIPPNTSSSRSPCPALNALANHGYIARDGKNIRFWTLLRATQHVYNLSFPLALLLTTVGYITCGTVCLFPPHAPHDDEPRGVLAAITRFLPCPTLNLASLSAQGPLKIAHDASLVHADDASSCAPDPALVTQLLCLAYYPPTASHASVGGRSGQPSAQTQADAEKEKWHAGLTLADLGRLHAAREAAEPHALNRLHEQVALGECGLAWCVMRERRTGKADEDPIPPAALEQWFGEERLPDGWWDVGGGRPVRTVGLLEAARRAKEVGLFKHRK
ncbi:putative peroxidase, family 2 [Lyophyllum shimeji]|uniref:Peroxidase, family 2 n=1 Tax=Lyophyllum shimeji TaxID=47721 RepID=A0A9P3PYA9_LYOSH|nr:putative peroxidase, family 2 [Lyophyllum shimeji]